MSSTVYRFEYGGGKEAQGHVYTPHFRSERGVGVAEVQPASSCHNHGSKYTGSEAEHT